MTRTRSSSLSRTLALGALVLAALSPAAVAARTASGSSDAVDVDRDGYFDAAVREKGSAPSYAPRFTWLTRYDVGAKCKELYSRDDNTWYFTLTIRPPAVWPIGNVRPQLVKWRAVYADSNGHVVARGRWVLGTARPKEAAEFGGIDESNIYDNGYYAGSQSWTHAADDANPIIPWVQVGWRRRNSVGWRTTYVSVDWVVVIYGYGQGTVAHDGNC